MDTYQLLKSPLGDEIRSLFQSCQRSLFIASPYVQPFGVEILCDALSANSSHVSVHVLTSLQKESLYAGSLDVGSLVTLCERFSDATVRSLPRLHAKVYVADEERALITSANLTHGGFYGNYEYGVLLTDPQMVSSVADDMLHYSALGSEFDLDLLRDLDAEVSRLKALKEEYEKAQRETPVGQTLDAQTRALDLKLLTNRIHGRTINAIFSETIRYLLSQKPMTTQELYRRIQEIHADICDDSIDLVISGQNFGRRWKHDVRNAQVFLRRRGDIRLADGRQWTWIGETDA